MKGITTLQSMEDADYLKEVVRAKSVKKAVIIGGGLIGIETCEALQLAGMEITIVEMLDQLLPFLDWEMAKLVENHIVSKGVKVSSAPPSTPPRQSTTSSRLYTSSRTSGAARWWASPASR